ncbi:prepilin-type N-terminal cleavage/methylation domain-containing protein [Candidatus Saccharibacteria bacterium]|nr:prepilin-type N-terminal cleavage/methylation domain-containing protein [Candidatus Saccharibacteria bacterium]
MSVNKTISHLRQRGFTIVELLIVIVVIAILAAITIVAYNGIQNRANDTSVKADMAAIVKKFELYRAEHQVYPAGTAQLSNLDLRVSRNAYGSGFAGGIHNLIYCRVAVDTPPTQFALLASSKSGTVFTYSSATGAYTEASAWHHDYSHTICNNAGIPQAASTDRDILYLNNNWAPWLP